MRAVQEKTPVSPSSSFSKEAQGKGAKDLHKYFMAKKSLNESGKSIIQKVVALSAHSNSSEHSSSSSKHKKTNGSTRSVAANKNSANSNEKLVKVLVQKQTEKNENATVKKIDLLPPSVQKAPRQVPNSHHAKSHQNVPPSPHENPVDSVVCVDTASSSVDTRSSSQKTCLAVLDNVSTQPKVVSTLVTLPRDPILPVWDSVSTHSEVVSTHSG
ncbi:hypothetical protein Taro_030660 [Colocasia esculenta]|uniref:Uncharacterized protein n=1 Tax=Colocasia esculenta TaxID=4460 RepID=A0A843VGW0_COLES|nr:hypothetical protein [Colocasia esculenta]